MKLDNVANIIPKLDKKKLSEVEGRLNTMIKLDSFNSKDNVIANESQIYHNLVEENVYK